MLVAQVLTIAILVFRDLSHDIYKRMLELGLKEYGNVGSFNFMLNSPIEYPNALVETLFP